MNQVFLLPVHGMSPLPNDTVHLAAVNDVDRSSRAARGSGGADGYVVFLLMAIQMAVTGEPTSIPIETSASNENHAGSVTP